MWTGLAWLSIGAGGELLWIRYWTFGFHKMLGNYRVFKQLGISRVVLSSMEFVRCRLRRIFGPKTDEVTGEWRRLHNEEFHDLYSSPSIIRIVKVRRMRWVGHLAWMRENRNAYRLLVGKPDWRRPLGRPRRRWLDNIRMDLVEVGWGDVDWIGLAQDSNRWRALVNSVLDPRVP
jgi:hypothetical protein